MIFDEKNSSALSRAGFGTMTREARRAGCSDLSRNYQYFSKPLFEAVLNFNMPNVFPDAGTSIGRGSYIVWDKSGEPVHQIRASRGPSQLLPFAGESLIETYRQRIGKSKNF